MLLARGCRTAASTGLWTLVAGRRAAHAGPVRAAPRCATTSFLGAALLVTAACGGATPAAAPGPATTSHAPAPTRAVVREVASAAPLTRWVRASVATLWVRPRLNRPVDAPAVSYPADPARWVASMTVTQKRWLVGRLETQALYGERVLVWYSSGAWSRVTVPTQPTSRSATGYPGWVPTVQLTATRPASAASYAVVTVPTAFVWGAAAYVGTPAGRWLRVSYATALPVLGGSPSYLRVRLLDGRQGYLRRGEAVLHGSGAPWAPTRAQAIAEARRFLGLQYLWAGTSGFGYDCSGLTSSVLGRIGVRVYRDASDQAQHGTAVAAGALAPGDLVFFRGTPTGPVTHVAMYAGLVGGVRSVIEAPATGLGVRVAALSVHPYYAGARRYLSR